MEPFGLFDLLKMLTPKTENQPPNTAENQAENPPPPPNPPQDTPPLSNACWDFLARHEERAKRTKR